MHRDIVQLKRSPLFDKATLLGVGPMSVNCVDATLEIVNQFHVPIIMIASRRQVDSEVFGGGYVNHWTTETFCNYVKVRDKNHRIFLARDHGGPWQSDIEVEKKMSLKEAMLSAKVSYQADIMAGMEIIHIDPGRSESGQADTDISDFILRSQELILFCYETAARYGKKIAIEIGTDEGIVGTATLAQTEDILLKISDFCKKESLALPSFMVVQTGTKVMEMRNVGNLEKIIIEKDPDHYEKLLKLLHFCRQNGMLLKEHNADYLSDKILSLHPMVGIDSANIAPEFGVIETKAFLNFLINNHLDQLHEKTIELAFNSMKWQKWMMSNSVATDYERAVIAGHYIFSTADFNEIKTEAKSIAKKQGLDLDAYLRDAIKFGIYRCIQSFGLLQPKGSSKKEYSFSMSSTSESYYAE